MHHQPSSAGPTAMSGYSAAFMYSSAIALPLPLPLDRLDKTQSSARLQRRERRQEDRAAAAAAAAVAARRRSPQKKTKHSQSDSRSSSSGQSQNQGQSQSQSQSQVSSCRPSHETALSSVLHHWNGPAAAATGATSRGTTTTVAAAASTASPMTAAASSVGHDDSHLQLFKASSSSLATGSAAANNSNLGPPPSPSTAAAAATATATITATITTTITAGTSKTAKVFTRMHRVRPNNDALLSSIDLRNALSSHPTELHDASSSSSRPATVRQMSGLITRAESISSASCNTSISARTMISTERPAAADTRRLVQRNGRTYVNDTSLPYPLPSDLTELHRQTLRTLLLIQVFGAPVCSPSLTKKPPQRVLEIGCGSGFWSMMCHQYFKGRGHGGISFTGIDIAPLAVGSNTDMPPGAMKPDPDMNWTFVKHDLRAIPWPLPSAEYDLIMVKDMSLATTNMQNQLFIDEYIRLLKPGGTLEIWESDHLIRMLRPHIPGASVSVEDTDEQLVAASLGAYVMNANTPLSAPLNGYLVEYNQWLSRALESRDLSPVPCTLIGPVLLQESETLADVRSRRLAIPLSEVRWEREGVGGIITKDGKPHTESKGKEPPIPRVGREALTAGQIALRQTALLTVVQQVQALEPILREVSGKSQDEWDGWLSKMMGDLMSESGTSWGECLEVGAWYAKKKKAT